MRTLTLIFASAALAASTAQGALLTFTDATAFNASAIVAANGAGPTVTENFTGGPAFTLFTPNGICGSDSVTCGFAGGFRTTRLVNGGYSETITLLTGNIAAFGATWDLTLQEIAQGLTLVFNYVGGGTETLSNVNLSAGVNQNGPFFFGVTVPNSCLVTNTSGCQIASVTLQGGNGAGVAESMTFDNLLIERYVAPPPPSDIPEPSTFGLMGAALVGLGIFGRRLR